MKNWAAIRARYLRDGVPTRLAGLAANLGRIQSFATQGGSQEVVASLIEERKLLIEWTTADTEAETAAELVALQVELAGWQSTWPQVAGDADLRRQLAEKAENWSRRILNLSGLLSPVDRAAGMLRGEGSLTEALREEHRKERDRGR